MAAVKGISKLSGQAKSNTYPQPDGVLGDCMLHYGKKLGEDSIFCMYIWKLILFSWFEYSGRSIKSIFTKLYTKVTKQ